ncbi:MAG: carbohydrate ABC transporter permease [Oscillospiraceae bacterium]|nr:carbohydrate ABC transporter permease [Oscillospiraceae bacterium]
MKRITLLCSKYFFMLVILFLSLAPIFWVLMSSFKTYSEINSSALSLPSSLSLNNYAAALKYAPIQKYFLNSIVIVGAGIIVTVIFVAMCAYAVSRFRFLFKPVIILLIAASLMLPAQSISQPLFSIFTSLRIFDTKLGLILVYSAMGIPMSFFVMLSYYRSIPFALEESAYIDGAGFFRTFFSVILPLAKPGLATVAMIQFINIWNEFYFALMLTSGDTARTIPIALNYYMSTFANNYSALFAAVIMTITPTIIFFIIMQKQVIDSLTSGAVKG